MEALPASIVAEQKYNTNTPSWSLHQHQNSRRMIQRKASVHLSHFIRLVATKMGRIQQTDQHLSRYA